VGAKKVAPLLVVAAKKVAPLLVAAQQIRTRGTERCPNSLHMEEARGRASWPNNIHPDRAKPGGSECHLPSLRFPTPAGCVNGSRAESDCTLEKRHLGVNHGKRGIQNRGARIGGPRSNRINKSAIPSANGRRAAKHEHRIRTAASSRHRGPFRVLIRLHLAPHGRHHARMGHARVSP
jgi:hypothetical protein